MNFLAGSMTYGAEVQSTAGRPKRHGTTHGSSSKKTYGNEYEYSNRGKQTSSRTLDGSFSPQSGEPSASKTHVQSSSPEPDNSEDDDYDEDQGKGSDNRRKVYHKTYNPDNLSFNERDSELDDYDSENGEGTNSMFVPETTTKPRKMPSIPVEERLRRAPENGWAAPIPMPKDRYSLAPHDKMMLERREAGETWQIIKPIFERMTGTTVGHTTLPNRHSRIKALFHDFTDEDDSVLLQTKILVEDTFEKEKWNMIQKACETRMGRRLPNNGCRDRFAELIGGAEVGNVGDVGNGHRAGNGAGHGAGNGAGSPGANGYGDEYDDVDGYQDEYENGAPGRHGHEHGHTDEEEDYDGGDGEDEEGMDYHYD